MSSVTVPQGLVVAIDGPSGSGKSSVSKGVARHFGLGYLDTGAMYRAATWYCLQNSVSLPDAAAIIAAVKAMPLLVSTDPQDQTLRVAEADITEAIRGSEVTASVSRVASVPAVREHLIAMQRAIIEAERVDGYSAGKGIVVEGRDITTVVAPQAHARLLLTASEQARLKRRAMEIHGSADSLSTQATAAQIVGRDLADSKVTEFTAPAPGVAVVDSTDLDLAGTIEAVLQVVREQVLVND